MATGNDSTVLVSELLSGELRELDFELLHGAESLHRPISHPRVQKPGLAFAGYYDYIKPGRVQIVGASETRYLLTQPEALRTERCAQMIAREVPVFIITKGLAPVPEFEQEVIAGGVPLLRSPQLSSTIIKRVSFFLEQHLVPSTHLHGVLLDIYGLGVLLLGKSGVGKSECALDLITRGHSLVADDRVTVKLYPSGELVGTSDELLRHHMELRGLGIVNVHDLFGLASVRDHKSIDLVIELEKWDASRAYDRLGLDESVYSILDTPCPFIQMPVALGRNMSILVEIAARNHLLKMQGHHSAREFARALEEQLAAKKDAQGVQE